LSSVCLIHTSFTGAFQSSGGTQLVAPVTGKFEKR